MKGIATLRWQLRSSRACAAVEMPIPVPGDTCGEKERRRLPDVQRPTSDAPLLTRSVEPPRCSPRSVALFALGFATLAAIGSVAQVVHVLRQSQPIASRPAEALLACRDHREWLACTARALQQEQQAADGAEIAPQLPVAAPERGRPETKRRLAWRAGGGSWRSERDAATEVTPGGEP